MLDANAYQLSKTVSNNLIRQCELLGKSFLLSYLICAFFTVTSVTFVMYLIKTMFYIYLYNKNTSHLLNNLTHFNCDTVT